MCSKFWQDVTIAAVGSGIGTMIGGGVAYLAGVRAAKWGTEAAQAAEEAHWEKRAESERAERRRSTAASLTQPLLDVRDDLALVGFGPSLTPGAAQSGTRVVQTLNTCRMAILPLVDHEQLSRRFDDLAGITQLFVGRLYQPDQGVRALADVTRYLAYVLATVQAIVLDRAVPPEAPPPDMQRTDTLAWEPPTEHGEGF